MISVFSLMVSSTQNPLFTTRNDIALPIRRFQGMIAPLLDPSDTPHALRSARFTTCRTGKSQPIPAGTLPARSPCR